MDKEDKKQTKPSKYEDSNNELWMNSSSYSDLPPEVLNWIEGNSKDLITIWNMDGKIVFVSQVIENMLGYSSDYALGSIVGEFLTGYDQKILLSRMQKLGDQKQKFRFHMRDVQGKYIWTETDVSIVDLEENNEKIFVGITRDITDRKELEEMMVRSEKLSVAGQLAAGIAHEIRNPLTSLKGFLQLLQSGVEAKNEYYNIMEEELQKIETITSELLFISKPMTDVKKPEKVVLLINDVITLLTSEAKRANVDFSLNDEQNPTVLCDRSQIKQVFINLLKNAIESMEHGGKIEIDVYEDMDKNMCVIDIFDEGHGISPDIVHKLTEPFFTTKKEGTGLGLMITNEILQRHGGRLNIYLPENKKGSHFQVSLPLKTTID